MNDLVVVELLEEMKGEFIAEGVRQYYRAMMKYFMSNQHRHVVVDAVAMMSSLDDELDTMAVPLLAPKLVLSQHS